MFKHILAPYDGSKNAMAALEKAVELAKLAGARLTVLTVYRHHSLLEAHEINRFGLGHTQVGQWMAREWGFSERMQLAVACSHQPLAAEVSAGDRQFVGCVALGAELADLLLQADREHCDLSAVAAMAEQWLAIDGMSLGNIVDSLALSIPAFERIFDARLIDQEKLQMISALAREKLAELRAMASGE